MTIINATKYDPKLTVEEQLEKSMTPDELKRWRAQSKPHRCQTTEGFLEADQKLKTGEIGPGTIWTCDECSAQKKVVHLGIAQETETVVDGVKVKQEIVPLAWRNIALGSR